MIAIAKAKGSQRVMADYLSGAGWCLTSYFLVAGVNTLNTKTHSSKEIAGFSFVNADAKRILLLQTAGKKQTVTFFRLCRNEAL